MWTGVQETLIVTRKWSLFNKKSFSLLLESYGLLCDQYSFFIWIVTWAQDLTMLKTMAVIHSVMRLFSSTCCVFSTVWWLQCFAGPENRKWASSQSWKHSGGMYQILKFFTAVAYISIYIHTYLYISKRSYVRILFCCVPFYLLVVNIKYIS